MANVQSNPNDQNPKRKYDLEDRTVKFSEEIIDFCRKISQDQTIKPLTSQLIRAGTSIGANYAEADGANSKKDFVNKIAIAKKEAKETKYWLRLVAHALPELKPEIRRLWEESQELNLIFAAIIKSSKDLKEIN